MKIRVAVLFGGKSVEHEVSVISAVQAMSAMDTEKYEIIPLYITKKNEIYYGEELKNIELYKDMNMLLSRCQRVILAADGDKTYVVKYPAGFFGKKILAEIDVAFPIVHGTNVEDGALQGYLKTLNLPFVGCDVLSSAIGMDKYVTKILLKNAGIPVLDCLKFTEKQYADNHNQVLDEIKEKIPFPVIVKPINLGSSVGITKVSDFEKLESALDTAFSFSGNVVVEHAVEQLKEINCAVLGDCDEAIASECEEPIMSDDILSYEDKYVSGGKDGGSKGMASLKRKIPAEISPETKAEIQRLAVEAFKCIGCSGVSRVDFLIDNADGAIYLNEFNTIPGSLSFYLWKPVGIEYPELIDRLISLALKRQRKEQNITYAFDTNILSMGGSFGAKGAKGSKLQ